MRCPNCSSEEPDGATECGACSIIFEKWRKRQAAPPAPASAAPAAAVAAVAAPSSNGPLAIVVSAVIAVAAPLLYQFVVKQAAERYALSQLEKNKTEDPARALAAAAEIVSFAIPGGTEGLFSSQAAILGMKVKVAAVGNKKEGVLLIVMDVSGMGDEEPEAALKGLREEVAGHFKIKSSETKQKRVAGQDAEVSIDYGFLPISAKESPTGAAVDVPMVAYSGKVSCPKHSVLAWSMGLGDQGEDSVSSVFSSFNCRG